MARKPDVGLGIDRMYKREKVQPSGQNICPPIRVGTMQYGAYTLKDARRRMAGDPCVPDNMRDALRDRNDY